MRSFILVILILFFQFVSAQEKSQLQKQLTQIMMDYPQKFRNLRLKDDSFHVKFQISGTTEAGLILSFDGKTYITSSLPVPRSDAEAKSLFDKWVSLLNTIDLNGAKLKEIKCEPDQFTAFCKQWRFDNSGNNISPQYTGFTLDISVIKIKNAFAAALKIGDL